jgi:osmotically inducible protein OsmC
MLEGGQAGCFRMALSNILSSAGHAPRSLRTNARVRLRDIGGAATLTRIDLDTEADVPGVREQRFQGYAGEAKANCPASRALTGIPEIALSAKLI